MESDHNKFEIAPLKIQIAPPPPPGENASRWEPLV